MKPHLRHVASVVATAMPVLTLTLVACVNTVRFPPDLWNWTEDSWSTDFFDETGGSLGLDTDTGAFPDDPEATVSIRAAWGVCDSDLQTVEVVTLGIARSIALAVLHADGRAESHPLRRLQADPNGNWDQWVVELSPSVEAGDGQTQFDCGSEAALLTYALRVSDEGRGLADCGVWGANPNQMDLWLTSNDPDYGGTCRFIEL